MSREINRLTVLMLLAFALVTLGTAYWQLIERDHLQQREDNPRRILNELNIQRGSIFDRDGELLAYSEKQDNLMKRVYPYPEVVSAIGYYSYTFGAAGLEDGMNDWLSGDDFQDEWESFFSELMHLLVEGGDIKTTLDISLQQQLNDGMTGQNGGAIVVHVPSGNILAMVSQPTYDPNRIEEERTVGSLLNFLPRNRVTERDYQPGGVLQTLLLSELLAANTPLDKMVSVKEITLHNPTLVLSCETENELLPLAEAYLAACPMPFISAVGTSLNPESLLNKFQAAGLLAPARLDGFLLPASDYAPPETEEQLKKETAGQGELTLTPLQAVQIIAAVVNHGNGVPLHLITATRPPDEENWDSFFPTTTSPAIMQPGIAAQIQLLQQENPLYEDWMYGHVSRAYAGSREYVWLLAWTGLDHGETLIMVIVLEGKSVSEQTTIDLAASILQNQ